MVLNTQTGILPMTTIIRELSERWQKCGMNYGDMVLVHSNISRTVKELRRSGHDATPAMLLDSFLQAVGPNGTLLFPLFNFDFCSGIAFDIRSSPSKMGVLTETARLYPDVVRTGHPVYSFAAIGDKAQDFLGLNNTSAYGEHSPFGILKRAHGKIAVLDLEDQDSMTFYHHVEEVKQVPYRYFKDFAALYTDSAGVTTQRTFQLYVRNIDRGVLTRVNPAGELMWERNLYQGDRPRQGSGLRTVYASKMFDFVASIIDSGQAEGLLYSIEGKSQ
jgi:aminoglycoside 3-N-acetyltransferase